MVPQLNIISDMLRGLHFWIYHLSTDVSRGMVDPDRGLVYIPSREDFTFSNNITKSNGLIKNYSKKKLTLHSFVNRVINDWNSLPLQLVKLMLRTR